MFDAANFWADSNTESSAGGMNQAETAAGVSEGDVLKWEQQHSVKLPAIMRDVLSISNGGMLRYEEVRIARLSDFRPLPDEFWEWSSHLDDEFVDRSLVIKFADGDSGGSYLLDFNANGSDGEPAVCLCYQDGGDVSAIADSVSLFFEHMMSVADEPSIDFDAALDRFVSVLAEETIDLSHRDGGELEQFLGRDEDLKYFLLTRETTPDSVTITRTFVPTPLKCRMSVVREVPKTYGLELHPQDSERIVREQSIQVADGKWKSQTSQGVPIYVAIESPDRDELMDARVQMVGPETAKRDAEREARQEEQQSKIGAQSPDEQQATAMQLLEKMTDAPVEDEELADVPDQVMEIVEVQALEGQLAGSVGRPIAEGAADDGESFEENVGPDSDRGLAEVIELEDVDEAVESDEAVEFEYEEVIEYEEVEYEEGEYEEAEYEEVEHQELEPSAANNDSEFSPLEFEATDDEVVEVMETPPDSGVVEIVESDLDFFNDEPQETAVETVDEMEFFDVAEPDEVATETVVDDDILEFLDEDPEVDPVAAVPEVDELEFIDELDDVEVIAGEEAAAGDAVLYKSTNRVFLKSDLLEFMSPSTRRRLADLDSRMLELGFQHLGDITAVVLSMRAYGGDERMWGIAYSADAGLTYEFFTRFEDGSSITTTTSAADQAHPELGIHINVHEDLSVAELQAEHSRYLESHAEASGGAILVHAADLTSFAIAIDEFMDRHPEG